MANATYAKIMQLIEAEPESIERHPFDGGDAGSTLCNLAAVCEFVADAHLRAGADGGLKDDKAHGAFMVLNAVAETLRNPGNFIAPPTLEPSVEDLQRERAAAQPRESNLQ